MIFEVKDEYTVEECVNLFDQLNQEQKKYFIAYLEMRIAFVDNGVEIPESEQKRINEIWNVSHSDALRYMANLTQVQREAAAAKK